MRAVGRLLLRSLGVQEHEMKAVQPAALCFFAVLASYFVLTPLRDEISVQLGTSVLPKLFVASVAVNVLAQSMTAHVLAPAVADRGAAIARLFAFVATVLLAFATAVAFSGQFASGLSPHTGDHGIRHLLQGAFQSAGDVSQEASQASPDFTVAGGNAKLSTLKRALFILFYMWMSTQNLVCTSVLWARCAEVIAASEARRVFGILAAAATAGQLAGASTMSFICRRCGSSLPVGVQVICLTGAAACNGCISRWIVHLQPVAPLAPAALSAEGAYAKVGVQGQIDSTSTGSEPDARKATGIRGRSQTGAVSVQGAVSRQGSERSNGEAPGRCARSAPHGDRNANPFERLTEGFRLIALSPLLRRMCVHLLCSYVVSSLLYFTRSVIVASSVSASGARMRWFAAMHAYSAAIVLTLQLFATGRVLRVGGATFALVSVPLVCACTTAALAFRATPATLLLAETLRKMTAYSLAKPARELLFTKVSSDARYKAKLVLDTVVQRGGDAIGAAVFSLLDPEAVGPRQLALICCGISSVWSVVAFSLGRLHDATPHPVGRLPTG